MATKESFVPFTDVVIWEDLMREGKQFAGVFSNGRPILIVIAEQGVDIPLPEFDVTRVDGRPAICIWGQVYTETLALEYVGDANCTVELHAS